MTFLLLTRAAKVSSPPTYCFPTEVWMPVILPDEHAGPTALIPGRKAAAATAPETAHRLGDDGVSMATRSRVRAQGRCPEGTPED